MVDRCNHIIACKEYGDDGAAIFRDDDEWVRQQFLDPRTYDPDTKFKFCPLCGVELVWP